MKAPFPYFGGKSKVATTIWEALGDVDLYVEPFAGSLAVLLARPDGWAGREFVNDTNHFVTNFWRALAADPDGVAYHADWPCNEDDLFARHMWLVREGLPQLAGNVFDPEYFDIKIAGWWVWGQCNWIGAGWCSGTGKWQLDEHGALTENGAGVSRRLPHLTNPQGINRQNHGLVADLTENGAGVSRNLPSLANPRGINRQNQVLVAYLGALAARLRYVTVCTGDWGRVVTRGATTHARIKGIFLDPPYSGEVRYKNMYATDDHGVAVDVREWFIETGHNDPTTRCVLAGYSTEHDHLIPAEWRRVAWKAGSAYQTSTSAAKSGGNSANRGLEMLWFTPNCVNPQLF